jgi:transcriptional regulator with XRE-family HTH domain
MGGLERADDRGRRMASRALRAIGAELRQARLDHDLSQAEAARACGISSSAWSRLELGEAPGVSVLTISAALSIVGLDLSLRAYPGGRVQRTAAHARLLERLHVRLPPEVGWRTEVPLPNPGDRRAWDALIDLRDPRIGVEAETRARDEQELERRLALKRRDGGVDHVLLLLANTRSNRLFVRGLGAGFVGAYPIPGRVMLARLGAGQDPRGSGIVLL